MLLILPTGLVYSEASMILPAKRRELITQRAKDCMFQIKNLITVPIREIATGGSGQTVISLTVVMSTTTAAFFSILTLPIIQASVFDPLFG